LRSILTGVRRLRPLIKRFRPDIVHTHLWSANIIGRIAGAFAGVKVISSIHAPEYEPEAVGTVSATVKGKIRIARFLDRVTANFGCDQMIAVSNYVKLSTNARLGFPLDKIVVLYNPVDFSGIVEGGSREEVFGRVGLPGDSKLILNVGRVVPQKGLRHAIRAMPAIVDAERHAHFVSVGNLESEKHVSALRALIAELQMGECVHLVGERRDIGELLARCDVFIFPSVFEGLGIALAEAMAAGCACVVHDIAPLNEFVENEVNGLAVRPYDPKALAGAVIRLLENAKLRESLGAAARTTAFDLFQPEAAAARLAEIYRSVAATKE
jgi:glycosyltransferase involved in cell wall biosynthesis